jgi:type IV pilus assembly protein PilN
LIDINIGTSIVKAAQFDRHHGRSRLKAVGVRELLSGLMENGGRLAVAVDLATTRRGVMIRINLLPPVERQPKRRTGRFFSALLFLVVLAFSGVWGYFFFSIAHTERRLEEVKNRHQLLHPAREAMLAANTKQHGIDAKNNVLIGLTRERTSWYAVFARLGAKTPPELWLTDLTVDKNALKLVGMVKNYPDLVTFMRGFEHDDLLPSRALVRAEKDLAPPRPNSKSRSKSRGR